MEILLAAIILIGLCVFGLCFNIIFRKNGKFPETDVGSNREMRKRGIRCAKDDELRMWGTNKKKKPREDCGDMDCSSCGECK